MDLVEDIYKVSKSMPTEEKYGLISQMRRAAVSVPSNIAEGAGRRTIPKFINFLSISIGSLSELDTQVELSFRLKYINEDSYSILLNKIDKCKALTYGLRKKLMNNKIKIENGK
ncbi:MAG: four helix bundle protein [Ignavibacteriae bacterium]|nr:four helix bundle protein [Ignavibacteriota bacterium]